MKDVRVRDHRRFELTLRDNKRNHWTPVAGVEQACTTQRKVHTQITVITGTHMINRRREMRTCRAETAYDGIETKPLQGSSQHRKVIMGVISDEHR